MLARVLENLQKRLLIWFPDGKIEIALLKRNLQCITNVFMVLTLKFYSRNLFFARNIKTIVITDVCDISYEEIHDNHLSNNKNVYQKQSKISNHRRLVEVLQYAVYTGCFWATKNHTIDDYLKRQKFVHNTLLNESNGLQMIDHSFIKYAIHKGLRIKDPKMLTVCFCLYILLLKNEQLCKAFIKNNKKQLF